MTTEPPPPKRGVLALLRNSFLTGLVIVAPAVLTIWIIVATVEFIDNRVLPLIPRTILPDFLTGMTFPGMGVLIFLIFTMVVGWLAKGIIGRSLIDWGERIVSRMPVVRSVYQGLKQIAETVFAQSSTSFNRACLVEYPRRGIWAIAFISTDTRGEIAGHLGTGEKHIAVFLPTTPNPTSGFLLFVPEADVKPLEMSVEDAAKLVISAGLVVPAPDKLDNRPARRR
ncbi:DUF502 domain-containing protein [Pararhodobacter sp. SW119]|uniref:DUF502 domain-containing protein n=1 Tax=Pararhodobacter sp. SW119 TaxID=2780075 RepID=UPI001ADF87B5|nr:DUF502 domain-containing protein [Pararhodobacter sp. SW119]